MTTSDKRIKSVRVRTEPRSDAGQDIVVSVTLVGGTEIDVIREFGALTDITIDHTVTAGGIEEAARRALVRG